MTSIRRVHFRATPRLPFWNDPWVHEWEVFRRHLVHLHYDELAQWLVEAGHAPRSHLVVAGADGARRRVHAVRYEDHERGRQLRFGRHVDRRQQAARRPPRRDRLRRCRGERRFRWKTASSLFATLASIDEGFAIVEFNTADLRHPHRHPTYAAGYRALRDLWNAGARFVSPMAWNGANGANASDAGYVTLTAWRNTPLEDAARDFLLARVGLAAGTMLWTFGTPVHADGDGWTAETGIARARHPARCKSPATHAAASTLHSPRGLALQRGSDRQFRARAVRRRRRRANRDRGTRREGRAVATGRNDAADFDRMGRGGRMDRRRYCGKRKGRSASHCAGASIERDDFARPRRHSAPLKPRPNLTQWRAEGGGPSAPASSARRSCIRRTRGRASGA